MQKSADGGEFKGVVSLGRGDHHGAYVTFELKDNITDPTDAFDNYVYSTGINTEGITGTNTTNWTNVYPVRVTTDGTNPLTDISQITAGYRFHVALTNTADANVYAWGYNHVGQLGHGVTGGISTLPTLVDKNNSGTEKLSNIMMVESGDNASHVLAVSKTGGVYVWGLNNQGQLGDQTTDNSPYPVVVGSSPVSLDSKVLRLHPTDEADVTATSSATVFSLFNTSKTTTS